MNQQTITAKMLLNPGYAQGQVLKLGESLSFWGGFDPNDGRILDHNHPQVGESISSKILVIPGSRGSAGTPGGIAEALRRKVGPAAILLLQADVNITIGAQAADFLYATSTPVLVLNDTDFSAMQTGWNVQINQCSILVE